MRPYLTFILLTMSGSVRTSSRLILLIFVALLCILLFEFTNAKHNKHHGYGIKRHKHGRKHGGSSKHHRGYDMRHDNGIKKNRGHHRLARRKYGLRRLINRYTKNARNGKYIQKGVIRSQFFRKSFASGNYQKRGKSYKLENGKYESYKTVTVPKRKIIETPLKMSTPLQNDHKNVNGLNNIRNINQQAGLPEAKNIHPAVSSSTHVKHSGLKEVKKTNSLPDIRSKMTSSKNDIVSGSGKSDHASTAVQITKIADLPPMEPPPSSLSLPPPPLPPPPPPPPNEKYPTSQSMHLTSSYVPPVYLPPVLPNGCAGRCGENALCLKRTCVCRPGYSGNPFSKCHIGGGLCGNKCGENADCDAGLCKCRKGFVGHPYVACFPAFSCNRGCGFNAYCDNRIKRCKCRRGFIGSPHYGCVSLQGCVGGCGPNAQCDKERNMCFCKKNCKGNPVVGCLPAQLCSPKCGKNAYCDVIQRQCRCYNGFNGDPALGCTMLPCEGRCGAHAKCIRNICVCDKTYDGDAYSHCQLTGNGHY